MRNLTYIPMKETQKQRSTPDSSSHSHQETSYEKDDAEGKEMSSDSEAAEDKKLLDTGSNDKSNLFHGSKYLYSLLCR